MDIESSLEPIEDSHLHARVLAKDGVRLPVEAVEHVEVPRRAGQVEDLPHVGPPPPMHRQQKQKILRKGDKNTQNYTKNIFMTQITTMV